MNIFRFIKWWFSEREKEDIIGASCLAFTILLVVAVLSDWWIAKALMGLILVSGVVFLLYVIVNAIRNQWIKWKKYENYESESIVKKLKGEYVDRNPYTNKSR